MDFRLPKSVLSSGHHFIPSYLGTKLLNLCEVYHVNTNSWEPIANLKTCRFALGSATLNSRIFAVGMASFFAVRVAHNYLISLPVTTYLPLVTPKQDNSIQNDVVSK